MARLYGRSIADEFGPVAPKVVRTHTAKLGRERRTINQRVLIIRVIIKWGVEHELIEGSRLPALKAVTPLKEGCTDAPESQEVQPVAIEHVEACIEFMPPTVEAMVRLQCYAGMRGRRVVPDDHGRHRHYRQNVLGLPARPAQEQAPR